jgi:tetratricopeptide (TPR) repeat protein
MNLRTAVAAVTLMGVCVFLPARAAAQDAKPPGNAAPADYSNQAGVIENLRTTVVYHTDGTWTTTREGTVKVQSQAGVQAFGMMNFPYASATTTMQLVYLRVTKPDKTVVTTPTENALDIPAQITQQAPFYSDLKVLQVAVKGLEAGDTLDFEWRADTTKPLDPGQFWNSYNFLRNAIVLHEELEISVPTTRKVIVKSAAVQPTVSESDGNKVYRWSTQNLSVKTADGESDDDKLQDVQVTTFQSWDEVGKWFGGLVASRATPTPEIKTKADELTRGATTQTEKIKDLYAFVSGHFRYIGIDLGIGRYQPHAAEDVLSNDYGDCKDKHTLFEALLAAEGIQAYPALINSAAKIDPDVPSPGQFDHVITAIPQEHGFLFLDTTPEVTPYGYMAATLRDKSTLVIPASGVAQLVKTPADPPFPMFEHFEADGTLDATGTLTSKMRFTVRDDSEFIVRYAFRQAGQAQWTEVMQKMSQGMGYGGTVSDLTVTSPEKTELPLDMQYSYVRKDYSDFSGGWISPPFPPLFVPAVPDDASKKTKPLQLGSPEEYLYSANIKLPAGMAPKLPDSVHLSEPFADFDATYTMSDGTLHAQRKLVTKEREVQPAEFEAYGKFAKAIDNDAKIDIYIGGQSGAFSVSGSSANPEALKLYNEGYQSWQMRDVPGAMEYFQQAVAKDPNFALAWTALGSLHAAMGPRDQGITELKKAISLDPNQPIAYEQLATLLLMQHQTDDALAVWKQLEQASPTNTIAPERIGAILLNLKRYPEAVTELEGAVKRNPGNAILLLQLGTAYAQSGKSSEAAAAFKSSLQADSTVNNLNRVAYAMADANLDLTDALQDAQKAVRLEEAVTADINLNDASPQDFTTASSLAAYWDTLGWAYFRTGDTESAEKYLNAGWRLSQDPAIADHLGQLYEKEGKKHQAIESYDLAASTGHAPDHTQARLDALGNTGFDPNAPSIQDLRIVDVNILPKPKDHASADFIVAISPDGNVKAKFVSGSEDLRDAVRPLAAAKFDFPFPDQGPVQIVRRGILDCEPELRRCSFAMYPLAYPQPLQTSPRPNPANDPRATVLELRQGARPVILKRGTDASATAAKSKQ